MKFGSRELLFLVVMVGLLLSAWYFVFKTADEKILALKSETMDKQQQIAQLKLAERKINDMAGKVDELRERIRFYEARLPRESEMTAVLKQIDQQAKSNKLLAVTRIQKMAPEKAAGYYELPVKILMHGDFRGFYEFLLQMERMDRIMRVNQMKLTKINEKDGSTTADMTISIFYAPDATNAVPGQN